MSSSSSSSLPPPPSEEKEVSPGLERLVHDVYSFQIPALLAPHADAALMQGKEAELLATLKRIDAELEDFALECADAGSNARERAAWSAALQRAQGRVAQMKREAQKALVGARQKYKAQARNALWSDMVQSQDERDKRREARLGDQSSEDKLMTASGDVTTALQRAVTLMSIELEKSSYSSQLLDESSMSIQRATLEYTSFTNLVSSSRRLIKSMERADFLDAIMLLLSFLFFVLCIAYIVKVRIWDRGIGVLSFLLRLGGLGASRSAEDVKGKLKAAHEAARQTASSIEASRSAASHLAKTTAEAAASIAATVTMSGTQHAQPAPPIDQAHDEL